MGSGNSHSRSIAIGGSTEEVRMRRAKGVKNLRHNGGSQRQMWLNVLDVAWRARIDKAVCSRARERSDCSTRTADRV